MSPRPDAVLLIRLDRGQQIIAHACGYSHRAGVQTGMSLANARTRLMGKAPLVRDENTASESAWLLAVARWVGKWWSPVVSVDGASGLLLDIAGCEHLFGGERQLLESLERAVRALGISCRAGIASTVGAAWAVARYGSGRRRIVPRGHEREALASLPIAALRIEVEAAQGLAEVGIDRVGQLLDLPRASLPARYGDAVLRRVDQALGAVPETIMVAREAPPAHASLELPGGTVRVEAIHAGARGLLDELAALLATRESGLRRLEVTLDRLGLPSVLIAFHVAQPTRDAKHLWALLAPHLERVHMGFGVERITLRAMAVSRMAHRQRGLEGRPDTPAAVDDGFAAVLDILSTRIGRERVLAATLHATHRPERAFGFQPADTAECGGVIAAGSPAGTRPSRLFEHPEPISTVSLSPDGPVLRVRRGGQDSRLVRSVGPERIGPEWWRGREPTRDYYRVQDELGVWRWIFREVDSSRWFIHGEWC